MDGTERDANGLALADAERYLPRSHHRALAVTDGNMATLALSEGVSLGGLFWKWVMGYGTAFKRPPYGVRDPWVSYDMMRLERNQPIL